MSINRSQLQDYFQRLLTPENFEDYAPNGLQVEGKDKIARVAFAVSATQDSIREAIHWGADALVVHHGIFWKHQGARTVTGAWGERVKSLVKSDLNLFAYHLPLDGHAEVGNAVSLARELGMNELSPFALYKRQPMGTKGKFSSPLSASELRKKLETILKHPVILATPDENNPIASLGIITGGANNEWVEAMKDNLDAYLTGEISEYNWHDAREAGIHYFAGGHHATERFGIMALKKKVEAELKLTCEFFDSGNPA
jgi:dinuclear metal center YbgI/SA1388 family protein